MLRGRNFGAWPVLFVALFAACKDDGPGPGNTPTPDGGPADTSNPAVDSGKPTDDGGKSDGTPGDGTSGDGTITPPGDGGGRAPCLDRPTDLDRPPSGSLPCELLPPGFVAP